MHDTRAGQSLLVLMLEDGSLLELRGKERYLVGRRGRSGENVPDVDCRIYLAGARSRGNMRRFMSALRA